MKTNRIISAVMSLCIAGSCLSSMNANASAEIIASGTFPTKQSVSLTWVLDIEGTFTINGEGDAYDWAYTSASVTPESVTVEWYKAGPIPWYDVRNNIKKIIIGEGITSISQNMFMDCDSLTEVVFPSTLTQISHSAFLHCQGLVEFEFPETVSTAYGSFKYCSSLESLYLPENITEIKNYCFGQMTGLKRITVMNPDCIIGESSGTISNYQHFSDETDKNFFDGIIYGWSGSTAQAYAEKYGYAFKALDIITGDVNDDGAVDSSDASAVLKAYANVATGNGLGLTTQQIAVADVNKDDSVDASDASLILSYYTYTATGGTDSLQNFLTAKK